MYFPLSGNEAVCFLCKDAVVRFVFLLSEADVIKEIKSRRATFGLEQAHTYREVFPYVWAPLSEDSSHAHNPSERCQTDNPVIPTKPLTK